MTPKEVSQAEERGPGRKVIRWLAYLLSILATAWVIVAWWDHWPQVAARVLAGQPHWLLAGLVSATGSAVAAWLAYLILVRGLVAAPIGIARLFNFYFVSQLLKHLPGRVWGIGYQAVLGREEGGLMRWVGVNLVHMAAATFWALLVAFALLSTGLSSYLVPVGIIAAGTVVFLAGILSASRLQAWLSRRSHKALVAVVNIPIGRVGVRGWVLLALALMLANLLQHASWVFYAEGLGVAGARDVLMMSAAYMLAWFIGYVALLTPSGLGVRELAFAWLASGHDPGLVALMMVVGRTSFLSVDLLLGATCLLTQGGRDISKA